MITHKLRFVFIDDIQTAPSAISIMLSIANDKTTQGAYDVHLAVFAHRRSPLNDASASPSMPSILQSRLATVVLDLR